MMKNYQENIFSQKKRFEREMAIKIHVEESVMRSARRKDDEGIEGKESDNHDK
jgi:hypothetical protein